MVVEAAILLEACRFGDDLRQKPAYIICVSGTDGHTMENALFIASRGLEEADWGPSTGWERASISSIPMCLVSFSISKEFVTTRYIGLEVPPDDTSDRRLNQPNVIAVLTYASADRVLREGLLTSDDPQQARLLRSYADVTGSVAMLEGESLPATANAKPREPSRKVRLSFSENYPSPSNTKQVLIPLQGDDLDLEHAQLPARIHLSAWHR